MYKEHNSKTAVFLKFTQNTSTCYNKKHKQKPIQLLEYV